MSLECGDGSQHVGPRAAEPGSSSRAGLFEFVRVQHPRELPQPAPHVIDVALLDMNHGWPNLGHDSLVQLVREAAGEAGHALEETGLQVRVLSFDVRRSGMLPEAPGPRHLLYLGTGGPGHVDPRGNDGVSTASQGIRENPGWEAPAFRLFDAIRMDPDAALLAVCHTFGVLCRWSGVATPVLRGPEKGKCAGVFENVLARAASEHPWFAGFARRLGGDLRFHVVENRLFDLLPDARTAPPWALPIGFEAPRNGADTGEALTMVEFARDRSGVVPRMLAVNHHPEIVDRARQRMLLEEKWQRGEVSEQWYRERLLVLTARLPHEDLDRSLRLTSEFTLVGPLRFHLFRAIRRRAASLGRATSFHEDRVLETVLGRAGGEPRNVPPS
jgi:hypothetical protein